MATVCCIMASADCPAFLGPYPVTSTQVGHSYRNAEPELNVPQLSCQLPLPPSLALSPQTRNEQVFTTTYRSVHNYEPPPSQYLHSRNDPPLKLDRVIYLKEFLEKVKRNPRLCWVATDHPSRTGLTETQEKFVRHPVTKHELKEPVPTGGSLERIDDFPSPPSAIIRELDPYISTTSKDHRHFDKDERECAVTYTLPEPVPSRLVQYKPMMTPDKPKPYWTAAHPRRVPDIPARGMTTEMRDSFRPGAPCDSAMFMAMVGTGNVDCAPTQSVPGGKLSVQVPDMYKTEQSNIGSGKAAVMV